MGGAGSTSLDTARCLAWRSPPSSMPISRCSTVRSRISRRKRATSHSRRRGSGISAGCSTTRTIDAISIATPNHWHSLMTIWACTGGQARVRGEAALARCRRGPDRRRGPEEIRRRRAARHAAAERRRHRRAPRGAQERHAAQAQDRLRLRLQAARRHRLPARRRSAGHARLGPVEGPGRDRPLQPQPRPLQLALVLEDRQRRTEQPGHPPARRGPLGDRRRPDASRTGRGRRRPLPLEGSGGDAQHDVHDGRVSQRPDRALQRPQRELRRLRAAGLQRVLPRGRQRDHR